MAINGAQLTSNDINWPLFIAEWLESLEKTPKMFETFYWRELQDRVWVLTDEFINIYGGKPWWYLYVRIKN